MRRRWLVLLALISAMALFTPAAMARGKKHGHHDDDDRGWTRQERYEYRVYREHEGRPPGWRRGEKASWRYCGLPPGQAKKYGCRRYYYQGRPHYYYQDDEGAVIVRRPAIQLHGSVDIVR